MNALMNRVRAAIRQAVGRGPLPKAPDLKLLEIPTELQKAMRPYRNAPQWVRLLVLYRLTKRQYHARRYGVSAKSPAANRKHGPERLRRATDRPGLQSYDAWKAEVAAERSAKRAVHSVSP